MKKFYIFILLCISVHFLSAQKSTPNSNPLWTQINDRDVPNIGTRYITPLNYSTFRLDVNTLKEILMVAPLEFTPVAQMTQTFISLPLPDGRLMNFDIVESPIMAPELAAQYPEINTYAGYAVEDKNITVRFDFTPQGFHAMIIIPGESTVFIDPYYFNGDIEYYTVYHRRDFRSSINKTMECAVTEFAPSKTSNEPNLKIAYGSCELRTYRLALAATGEYTAFHGGTVALALAAQNTTMNRINAVYGREMAVRMNLVANNNLIIYTNGGTDPYTNNNGSTMLNQNQTNLTTVIGGANYDIGHVFSTGGGGIAQLGSVCNATGKARGVTGSPSPIGDPFDIDYVAHEMGHQFGCNHTFNNNANGSCAGNANATTSMEPGSGSTIMAYAGICTATFNVQNNSNDYFHTISLQEMGAFVTGAGNSCAIRTAIANSTPNVTPNATAVVIPQGTPFFLTATGSDPDGNTLTYCWEQMDAGTSTTTPTATQTTRCNFRSFNPTTNPTRFFPNLTSLAANGPFTWEVLPTVSRTMNFRVTVRDNASVGGCTIHSNVTVTVNNTAGPFTVTSPTNTGISYPGASTQTVTWNVANTTAAPVSCANVDILISTDGGQTYTVLLSNTPNDGTQAVTIPNTPSTTCRIMVRCAGGYFFDISNNNFTITAASFDFTLTVPTPSVNVCQPNNAVYNINTGSIGGFSNPITLSTTGLPAGAIATFATNPVTPGNSTTLTISGTASIVPGTYTITLNGNSTTGTKTVNLTLNVSTGAPTTVTLQTPANTATNVTTPTNFNWTAATGTGVQYAIVISTSPTLTPIIDQSTGLTTNSYSSIALSPSSTYYWRVTASNSCGTAPASSTFSFTTGISGCDTISNFQSTHTARVYLASGSWGYLAGHNGYGDLAKADKYTYTGTNTHIKGAYFGFGRAFTTNATRTFNCRVWDGTTGSPTTVLASVPVTYQSVQNLIAGGNNVGYINFGAIPLPASKIFFVGIEFTYNGDTIALITNTVGQTVPATAWEKFSNGTWVPYDDPSSWGAGLAHYIYPVLGSLPNADFTPVNPVACTGATVNLTNTSSGASTYNWTMTSGNPNTSTIANTSVSYAAPGTYTIRLIATNDCMSDTTSTNVTVNAVTISNTQTNVSCNGGNNGSISSTPTGAVAPYTFAWSNGRTTATITGLTAGTYTVTSTDANGCSASSSITVTQPSSLSVTTNSTNVNCFGNATGNSTVTASGGTPSYNYIWSNGRTSATNTGLSAGTYTISVTDINGCRIQSTVTITQPTSALALTPSQVNPTCNGSSNGSATISATGGVAPYLYLWSNGRTTVSITGLTAGIYTVTVTDANNCNQTNSITLTQPSAISITSTSTNPACNGLSTGSINTTTSGGNSVFSYLWSNGRTTANLTGLSAGTYTLTVTDGNACQNTRSVTITQPSAITVVVGSTNISCFGNSNGSATVTSAGGTVPFSYIWSNGRTTVNNTGLVAGVYSVTATDANGCQNSNAVTITQPTSALALTPSQVNPTCNGSSNGSATISATGGVAPYLYLWSNGRTTVSITGLTAGIYTVTVTDANNCNQTNSITLTQPNAISITSTSTNPACNGLSTGSINTTTSGGNSVFSYLWSNGRTTANLTGLSAGTYTLTVTDGNACQNTRSVTITQPSAITVVVGSTNISCFGNSNGSATVTSAGGIVPFSYIWSNGRTTVNNTGLVAGVYSVTATDANGCQNSNAVTITQPSSALALLPSQVNPTCNGSSNGSATISATGGVAPYLYLWSNGRNTVSNTGLTAGTYTVTVTDANNCNQTNSITLTQPSAITATTTSTNPTCNGATNGNAAVTASGATAPYTFSWSNGRTTASNTGLGAGTYTVVVTDANNCSVSRTVTITQPSAISITSSSTPQNCNPNTGSATATANGGTGTLSYAWNTGATSSVVNNLNTGAYTVTVTDTNLCNAITTVSVGNSCVPCTLGGTTNNTNVSCNGGSNGVAIAAGGSGTLPYSYVWSNGQSGSQISGLSAGVYTVTISDNNNCTFTTSATVTQPSAITATTTSTNPTCNGATNGNAAVTASGGTAPYTFSWSNGSASQNIANLVAGNYTVTITDNINCTATSSLILTEPTPLQLFSNAVGTSCGSNNGQASVTYNGGISPYTILWSNSGTSNIINNLSPGNYIATISDANGCQDTIHAFVTNGCNNCNIQSTAFILSGISCNGESDGIVRAAASGGVAPYTFNWSNGALGDSISNLSAGIYTVTITDNQGCTATNTITLNDPLAISVTLNAQNPSTGTSNDGSINTSVSFAVGSVSYIWSNAGNTPNLSGLTSGTYSVTVTDQNGCTASASTTLSSPTSVIEADQIQISVFPNPTQTNFQVHLKQTKEESIRFTLTDVLGRTLKTFDKNGVDIQLTIEMDEFSAGNYFLSLQSGTRNQTIKLVYIR